MLLDIQDDIQPNNIHLLEWPLRGLQDPLEYRIDLFGRAGTFGGSKESFTLNRGPDAVIVSRCSNDTAIIVPVVKVAHRWAFHVERLEAMGCTLLHHGVHVCLVRGVMAHDLDCCIRVSNYRPSMSQG